MKNEIREISYTCDKCGGKITDTVFFLRCYAETINGDITVESAIQNVKQNTAIMFENEKHLCKKCKDALTDGMFIV